MKKFEILMVGVGLGIAIGLWLLIAMNRYHQPMQKIVFFDEMRIVSTTGECGENGLVVDWYPDYGICI